MNPEPPARPHGAGSLLGFGERGDDAAEGSPLELEDILTAIRETAYRWDFASDRIDWAPNAETVLGVADPERIGKGRAFALLVDPEHAGPRYDGITGGPHVAPGTELRYCLRYRFLPEGRRGRAAVWVEDTGVCSIDAEARPRLAQGTLRVIDNRRRDQEERLLYLGNHDELTGQLNRTRLTEELTRFLGTAGRTPAKGAFLLAGVNDLTLINETYGYDVGDEVITIVGRRIGRALRGRDCIGRFSSNKFGIVLQDCSAEGAEAIARRIMAAVRDSVIDTSVGAVATTLSVGAVLLPQHAGNAQAAIGPGAASARSRAQQPQRPAHPLYALRTARLRAPPRRGHRRRGGARAERPPHDPRAAADRHLAQPRARALRMFAAHEAARRLDRLGRRVHPGGRAVRARQAGRPPRARARHRAAAARRRTSSSRSTSRRRPPPTRNGCKGSRPFPARRPVLPNGSPSRSPRRPPSPICTRPPNSWRRSRRSAAAWRSTISARAIPRSATLRLLGVDMVKIDGSFIQNLGTQAEDELFVRTLIDLAKSFGITTVGEWVGDEKTARLLEKAGVSYMQGYFFGAPELTKEEPAARPAAK